MHNNFSHAFEILLLGFHGLKTLTISFFLLLMIIYFMTIGGNLLIIILVSTSKTLHSPMYFFLTQLSFSDILLTTTIVPLMLQVIVNGGSTVTFNGCLTQFFLFTACEALECLLLTVMSYDRYQAICHPLHYTSNIDRAFCLKTVLLFWLFIFIIILMLSISMSYLEFCGLDVIDHFFCDFAPLLKLSCSDTSIVEMESMLLSIPLVICPFTVILVSYVYIVFTILKIPSVTGRQKTFSTCSSHLLVVSLYYGSLISIYLFPNQEEIRKVLSLFYTVITPLLNPIIYSLRNKDIKLAFVKSLSKLSH